MSDNIQEFEKIFDFILEVEGEEHTNHKNDKGGSTKRGVTQVTLNDLHTRYPSQMKGVALKVENLTMEDTKTFYKVYIQDSRAHQIKDEQLRFQFVDTCVNFGIKRGIKILQEAVGGVVVDGKLGPQTIEKINSSDGNIYDQFHQARKEAYRNIVVLDPTQKQFEKGWYIRANKAYDYGRKHFQSTSNLSTQSSFSPQSASEKGINLDINEREYHCIKGMRFYNDQFPSFLQDQLQSAQKFNGIDLEDIALCLSVFYDKQNNYHGISFSLDPWEENNPQGQYQRKVLYPDIVLNRKILEGSRFGELMFECDFLMKKMSLGYESDSITPFVYPQELILKGLLPIYKIEQQKYLNQVSGEHQHHWSRLWIVCKKIIKRVNKEENTFVIDDVELGVETRQMEQNSEGKLIDKTVQDQTDSCYNFAQTFTTLLPTISLYYPCFEELKKLYKAVFVAKLIYQQRISVDLPLIQNWAKKQFINESSYNNKIQSIKQMISFKVGETRTNLGNCIQVSEQYQQFHVFGGVDMNCSLEDFKFIKTKEESNFDKPQEEQPKSGQINTDFSTISNYLSNNTIQSVIQENKINMTDFREVTFMFCEMKYCKICGDRLTNFEMNNTKENNYLCSLHHPQSCFQCCKIISSGSYVQYPSLKIMVHEKCKDKFQKRLDENEFIDDIYELDIMQ